MRTLICCFLLTLILAFSVEAQIPRTISYQGILTDTLGNPRPDGAYAMTFRLYPSGSGGSALWSESKSLQLKGGLFSTSLGDAASFPASLTFNAQYWLSVQVGAGSELAPRTAMTATPYSLYSEKADSARIAGGVGPNAVTTSGIADNAVTAAKIQNGSVLFADMAQNGAANGQVMKWNGSAWTAGNDSVGGAGSTGPWQLNGTSAYYNAGNVGIGTSSPGFPLNFSSLLGDKISLWGLSGPHYGLGVQSGQLQIHTDVIGSDILFGYGMSGAFTERMRIKGNGFVGIGNSAPNAPLAFPPSLGKKITLYPGVSGDVGFGVAGNRLQIYADNPNADVAMGYDAAGVFNERFAVKPTGALAVSGNTGAAKQVLVSGGSGPAQWQPLGGILQTYFNNQTQVSPLMSSTTGSFVFNNHSYTVATTANVRLVISGIFSFRSVECFACTHTEDRIRILLNGGVVGDYNFVHTANGLYSAFTISNFMYDLTPGSYTVSFELIHYTFSGTTAYAWLQSSSLMVLPL